MWAYSLLTVEVARANNTVPACLQEGVTTIGDECNRVRWLLIRQWKCAAATLDGGRDSLRESVFDGDLVLVLQNEIMQEGVHRDIPIVIDVEDKATAMVEPDTVEGRIALTMRTMKSLIGEYSNYSSAYHNKCPRSDEQKQLYEKYVDQISVLTGKAIDQIGHYSW
nr:MAG TPA: hypothetical protein [Caudoviricetes sp.]